MRSRLLGNLALAALSGALVLAPAEWLARRELANAHKGKGDGTLASYQEHDELLGWRKRAGARARFDRREYDVEVRINSHGLRDVERAYERSEVARRLREIASRTGVPFLDLTPDLREAERGWGSPYYTHDGHWNALGHDVAARAVEGELGRLGWLPSCSSAASSRTDSRGLEP